MRGANTVGKYRLSRSLGEGAFSKVKLAVNMETYESVAVKIIDKKMVQENKLINQVKREISTMKMLHHPNIVKIHEVIATKTKIYLIMEYISGGQLSDKMCYLKKLEENEARSYFHQLIDVVHYCHARGVYHRDLKPENLLLDQNGTLKVTDFGLSVITKPGDLLSTACGSPSYVAPEVLITRSYEGAAADIWSCGVILFELLAGYLPFEDHNLINLFRKISRADFTFPSWFTDGQRKLLSQILDPSPIKRATIAEILENEWFRTYYKPAAETEDKPKVECFKNDYKRQENTNSASDHTSRMINAFQLIALSNDLDFSGLFRRQVDEKIKLGSEHSIEETIEMMEAAARDVNLSSTRMVGLNEDKKLRMSNSHLLVSAEVIEVTPHHCVVELSKSTGDIQMYKEFCRSLSNVLKVKSHSSSYLRNIVGDSEKAQPNGEEKVGY